MKPITPLFFLLFCSLSLYAADLSDLTYTTTGGEVTITDCERDATGRLVIPDTIDGNPVTSIGAYAFNDNKLTFIEIPDGVTSIGFGSFVYCSSLTSITIPEGVTSIGANAFKECPASIEILQVTLNQLSAQLATVTAERNAARAQRDARPTTEAYDTAVSDRDSKIGIINQLQVTVEANNSKIGELEKRPTAEQLATAIAERDARPTKEAYDTVVAERDARSTTDELQDARNGSVVIDSSNGEAILSLIHI